MIDVDSILPTLQLFGDRFYEFPSRKAITRVQTSPNVDISQNSNGHKCVMLQSYGWAR